MSVLVLGMIFKDFVNICVDTWHYLISQQNFKSIQPMLFSHFLEERVDMELANSVSVDMQTW